MTGGSRRTGRPSNQQGTKNVGIFRRGRSASDVDPDQDSSLNSTNEDTSNEDTSDGTVEASDGTGEGTDEGTDDPTGDDTNDGTDDAADVQPQDGSAEAGEDGARGAAPQPRHRSVRVDRTNGPFDRSEVKDLGERIDLGSLCLAVQPGMQLRLELDAEQENIVGATAVIGDAATQLQAFAAPRSEGIWDDIRTEIAQSVTQGGGTVDEVHGPLGWELRTRMPTRGRDRRTTYSPARFVGVDGPRWFLRAVLTGSAAAQDEVGDTVLDFVRATVVDRGSEAMAPRELLPLKVPEELTTSPEAGAAAAGEVDNENGEQYAADELKPFERGPEITETR